MVTCSYKHINVGQQTQTIHRLINQPTSQETYKLNESLFAEINQYKEYGVMTARPPDEPRNRSIKAELI